MKTNEMKISTPRGMITVHEEFDSLDEARKSGWGLWFQHGEWLILARDNRCGAVVNVNSVQE